jgi:hypothetical protein
MFDINTLIRIVESPFLLRFYLSKKVVCRSQNFIHLYYDFNKDTAENSRVAFTNKCIKLNPGNPLRGLRDGNHLFIVIIGCPFISSNKKLRERRIF